MSILLISSCLCVLAACSLAPDLQDPLPKAPAKFKEANGIEWKQAEPIDAKNKGKWWMVFKDEKLNALEEEAILANQSMKAAAARVKQARAEANVVKGGLFPSADITGSGISQGGTNALFPGTTSYRQPPLHVYTLNGTASYDVDILGKASDSYLSALFLAQSQAATYNNLMLSLQADVATSYFTLTLLDEQIRALNDTVRIRDTASLFIKHQMDAGLSSELDYSRVQAELATAKAELYSTQKQRANAEHNLAILLGKNPSEYSFAYSPLPASVVPPKIPAGLPSRLVERRPDIAAAERQMASANRSIGVARTAFFPSISLSASGGSQTSQFPRLFQWASHTWAIGPSIDIPLFQGGSNFANLDKSKAAFEETVANYRQTVLNAFREVEDGLSDSEWIEKQEEAQAQAAVSARTAARLADIRYQIGDLNYLDVEDTERTRSANEIALAQARLARYSATINLIRALGGGWE